MATNPTLPADKTALFTKKAKTYTSSVLQHWTVYLDNSVIKVEISTFILKIWR